MTPLITSLILAALIAAGLYFRHERIKLERENTRKIELLKREFRAMESERDAVLNDMFHQAEAIVEKRFTGEALHDD